MRTTAAVAIAAVIVLTAAQAAAASSHTAYFRVKLRIRQDVTWTQHTTSRTCDGGSADIEGNGTSALRLRTPRAQPAIAKRVGDRGATLLFGDGKAQLPVVGTITRKGTNYATRVTPGELPACRPSDSPTAPDCGTKPFPAGRVVGVGYYTPERWPFDGLTPLGPSIVLVGPSAMGGFQPPIFRRCPGVNGDDLLRGPVYENDGAHSSPGGLKPAKLFGTLRRFKVTGHSHESVDAVKRGASGTGTWPITTTTHWTLTFTRLAHRPGGL